MATAMAQIINFHQWPAQTSKAMDAYTTSSFGISVAAHPVTTFNWNNMLDNYTGSEDAQYTSEVAKLMSYCGCSVNMDYGPQGSSGSGASSGYVPSALIDYFGYNNGLCYVSRDSYSISEWDALIYNELKSNRPVYYSGASSSAGHAFVCDGYSGDAFYHINWGWGGYQNGYFRLSIMNPGSTGIGGGSSSDGFSMGQAAVIGICKPGETISYAETVHLKVYSMGINGSTKTFSRTANTNDFTGVPLYQYAENDLPTSHSFDYGIGLYKDGTLLKVLTSATNTLASGANVSPSYTLSFGAGLAAGTYQLMPISKETGSSTWLLDVSAYQNYIEAVITDTQLTLNSVYLFVPPTVNSVTFTGDKIVNSVLEIKANLTNSSHEYSGTLSIWANGTKVASNGVEIGIGKTTDAYFHYTPTAAGTYNIVIKATRDAYGSSLIDLYTTSVVIADESSTTTTANLGFAATIANSNSDDPNNLIIYGNSYKCKLKVTNNGTSAYNGKIDVWLWIRSGLSASSVKYQSQTVNIPVNSSSDLDVEFNDLNYGSKYSITAQYYSAGNAVSWENILWNSYAMTHGVGLFKSDGTFTYKAATSALTVADDIVAVDFQGVTTVTSVSPNSNPNCLYFLDSGATVPSGITGKNVVLGDLASNITLKDGYSFNSPYDFTATNISYSRTFTKGTEGDGKNWSTLILPFKPTSLVRVSDNKALDWFHSKTEKGKMVWIDDFCAEDNDTVYFDYAGTELLANHPYIINVAGNKWGEAWSLVNKEIAFKASNAAVPATPKSLVEGTTYNFLGSTASKSVASVYYLNDEGNNFAFNSEKTVEPFRAYFILRTSDYGTVSAKSLNICMWNDEATGISQPKASEEINVDVYNLDGVKVRSGVSSDTALDGLSKGIYIINGKKVVK
jgi:hypothetical protein